MLQSFHVVLGLSPVWNWYLKGKYTTGANKPSTIAYDEIKIELANDKCLSII